MPAGTLPAPAELVAPPWQFSLRHLFVLTTMAAVAAAVAAHLGPGTLITSGGLIVAWLNWGGTFQALQSGRRQALFLWLAWGLFAVSFALPSIKIFGPVFGWNAAWAAIALPWEELSSGRLEASRLPALAWLALLDLANLLAACLPLLIWRFARGGGQILSSLLAVAMVGPWLAGSNPEGMLVGYYVWSASFSVALIALPIGLRTFAGMLTVALLAYIAALWH